MKHKLIKTEKARVLIVDLPAGANRISVFNDERPYISYFVGHETFRHYIQSGTWLPAGKLGEVPEKVADKIVEQLTIDGFRIAGLYKDYEYGSITHSGYEEAVESLQSLIESEISLGNPFGKIFDADLPAFPDSSDYEEADQRRAAWLAEEETVYRNPFLFFELK